jgi:hypothetical protein
MSSPAFRIGVCVLIIGVLLVALHLVAARALPKPVPYTFTQTETLVESSFMVSGELPILDLRGFMAMKGIESIFKSKHH